MKNNKKNILNHGRYCFINGACYWLPTEYYRNQYEGKTLKNQDIKNNTVCTGLTAYTFKNEKKLQNIGSALRICTNKISKYSINS